MEPSDVAPSIALLSIGTIAESPTNPRRTFDQTALDELTESVREKGILQPVLVRPAPGAAGYELVFGHRRVRAARAAGLTHVPAMVASMDDRQVLEAQVVENQQRTDVHPLEEADGYLRLHEKYCDSVEEIASKVGKSSSYVYKRMQLCNLGEAGRTAFYAGTIDASRALLLARIPDTTHQAEALAAFIEVPSWRGAPMPLSACSEYVRSNFMRRLSAAPFNAVDANLTSAPACAKCPKRTGAQPELFFDVAAKDTCTDLACWKEKADAHWLRRRNDAFVHGQKVLEGEKAAEVFAKWAPDEVRTGSGYVDLAAKCPIAGRESNATWGELLSKLPEYSRGQRTMLVRSGSGRAVEVVVDEDAVDALREAGLLKDADEPAGERAPSPEALERQRENELQDRIQTGLIAALVDSAEADSAQHVLKLIAGLKAESYTAEVVAERRGWISDEDEDGEQVAEVMASNIRSASPGQLLGLALELALTERVSRCFGEDKEKLLADALEHLGVDRPAVEQAVREEVERERAKAEKAAKRAAKKAAKDGSKKKAEAADAE